MTFLATMSDLSGYDLGAVVFIFIIAAGLLKLLTFVVKERFKEKERKSCGAFKKGFCPLTEDSEKTKELLNKIYDLLCGPQAMDGDVPRWYFPKKCENELGEMFSLVNETYEFVKSHMSHMSTEMKAEFKAFIYEQLSLFFDEFKALASQENHKKKESPSETKIRIMKDED